VNEYASDSGNRLEPRAGGVTVPAEPVLLVERTAPQRGSWSNTAMRSSGGKGKIRRSGFDALCTFG
jgi:hypothetical protein